MIQPIHRLLLTLGNGRVSQLPLSCPWAQTSGCCVTTRPCTTVLPGQSDAESLQTPADSCRSPAQYRAGHRGYNTECGVTGRKESGCRAACTIRLNSVWVSLSRGTARKLLCSTQSPADQPPPLQPCPPPQSPSSSLLFANRRFRRPSLSTTGKTSTCRSSSP